MLVSVVIVNFNVCYFLEQCLNSVQAALKELEGEIIVVDNGSTDQSAEILPGLFPNVRFIWNQKNLGFSKANNQGVAVATGTYVLLLNPDTLVPENAISEALSFLQSRPQAGAVGMRMFDGRIRYLPESKRGFPDFRTAFYKLSGLIRLFPSHPIISRYYLGHLSADAVQKVDVLAGAFMFLPKSLYLQVGGLDEAYFMYGEDIDLSYAITRAGYQNYYLPEPGIIHFKGESTIRTTENARHFYKAMQIFRQKQGKAGNKLSRWLVEAAIAIRSFRSKFRKRNDPVLFTTLMIFDLCTSLDQYQPSQPTIFQLGDKLSMANLLAFLRKNPPSAPIRFHWKGSSAAVGSENPSERGVFIPFYDHAAK